MADAGASRRVTRSDVARFAGVSSAVVSYVVNNGPRPVAPETAARVRGAMEVLQYRPNLSARSLKGGRSATLGLVLADSLNPYFAEFTLAMAQAAEATGHRLLIADSRGDADAERLLIEDLLARQVDGLLLASAFEKQDPMSGIRTYGVPTVLIDCPGPVNGRASLGPDAMQGTEDLIRHLIEVHGRTRIALAIGQGGFGSPDPREWAWQRTLHSLGAEIGEVARTTWSREGGYEAGQVLLQTRRPDAIFACSDLMGVGVLRALHEAGLAVPDDISVVSFDGTKESEFAWPPLTVARQPIDEMARRAVSLLDDPDLSPGHHEFAMQLVVRRSCGC